MASAALEAHRPVILAPLGRSWRMLVAARMVADGGATRAELAKDLGALTAHRLSPAEWRGVLDHETAALLAEGYATEARSRVTLTAAGHTAALEALGIKPAAKPLRLLWSDVRDIRLIAVALGIEGEPAAKLRLLGRPDGLRAAVLQTTYALTLRSRTSPARLRAALAVIALQRAFGNSIRDAMDAGAGLSAKAGRLLAGQLAHKPRDFGTDARLIAALAAEAVGSPQSDADAVRAAILRRFVGEIAPAGPRAIVTAPVIAALAPPLPAAGMPLGAVTRPPAASRPDLEGFAKAIQALAGACAEGWPGNRKAYISDIWLALRSNHPQWGLSEIEFKSMLAEAHRTGHVILANADLKDRRSLAKVQMSALAFKNAVLHYVRVTD